MGYELVLPIVCPILAVRFAFETQVSVRFRCIVGGIAIASFLSPWYIVRVLLQLADSVFVLLYLKSHSR